MRVLMVSKALVSGTSQRKLEELARCGAELTLVTPPLLAPRRRQQAGAGASLYLRLPV